MYQSNVITSHMYIYLKENAKKKIKFKFHTNIWQIQQEYLSFLNYRVINAIISALQTSQTQIIYINGLR